MNYLWENRLSALELEKQTAHLGPSAFRTNDFKLLSRLTHTRSKCPPASRTAKLLTHSDLEHRLILTGLHVTEELWMDLERANKNNAICCKHMARKSGELHGMGRTADGRGRPIKILSFARGWTSAFTSITHGLGLQASDQKKKISIRFNEFHVSRKNKITLVLITSLFFGKKLMLFYHRLGFFPYFQHLRLSQIEISVFQYSVLNSSISSITRRS